MFFLLLIGCETLLPPGEDADRIYDPKVEIARDVETVYSSDGQAKVKVTAPLLTTHFDPTEPYTEFGEGLIVSFYDQNRKERSRLTAKYAIRYEKSAKVFIRDSVRIVTEKDELIESDELIWNEKSQEITSDKRIKVTTEDRQISGIGFVANQDFSVWEIGEVTGWVKVDDKDKEEEEN